MNKIPIQLKVFLIVALSAVAVLTLITGETSWSVVQQGIIDRFLGNGAGWNALLDERLPRLLVTLMTGASLAVAGGVMQSIFHNPLATPSVLGISTGGSLLVILILIPGWHLSFPYLIPIGAVAGCLATLCLVYFLSSNGRNTPTGSLILTGIAISTVLIAIQGAVVYFLREHWQLIQTITEWEAGTTYNRTWTHVHLQMPLTIVGLWGCLHYRQEINMLALGEEDALNMGVDVNRIRWRLFLCVALLTGGALSAMGVIAFFGLILPHVVRSLFGPNNMRLIPLCIPLGALTMSSLDLILRVLDIQALSIGNISAILGGIFFLVLMFGSEKKRWYHAPSPSS